MHPHKVMPYPVHIYLFLESSCVFCVHFFMLCRAYERIPNILQFVARKTADPLEETRALTLAQARQLVGLPEGDSVLAARDRAILKFYVYTGARVATGCRVLVSDFHQDEDGATITLNHKGDHRVTIGLDWR